ncbi:acyl-CoA N-acyltransferase [Sporodiniella umbellata]|nr:acyl-CoA N-acyltransferase [Sporodiniella umbellata]
MILKIRPAAMKDLDAIIECEKECFHKEEVTPIEELTAICKYASRFRPELFLVATIASEIVGFICCSLSHETKISEKSVRNYEKDGRTIVCQTICVNPRVQKSGIAKNLVNYWINRVESARKYERIILYGRDYLRKFYQDLGFICLGPSDIILGPSLWMDYSKELKLCL